LGRATVVVNEDQLSLAIGKRGQNVRLAARLTGWDIDILTPTEFQRGTSRLDATLKQIPGVTKEMIDRVIVMGLIDVRDMEEVGTGPLMEELSLDEATATAVVERCAAEAKLVAVEQEAKKIADASAKAAEAQARLADKAALLALGDAAPAASSSMPGPLEAVAGASSEVVVHSESSGNSDGELSAEGKAISGLLSGGHSKHEIAEEDETAALAEGLSTPPKSNPDAL
jgi:N utilization substance protein A